MELSSVFGGDSLKAADLQGTEPTVTISRVEMKEFDKSNKLVITFAGKKKVLICNKTNANRIAYAYGTNTDHWIGQQIQLYVDLVDFQGKPTEAIRIRPPMKSASVAAGNGNYELRSENNISTGGPAERTPQPPMRRADPDDVIPF